MGLVRLWSRISQFGADPGLSDRFRRKIVLTNQISALAGVVVLASSLAFRVVLDADVRMVLVMLAAVVGYLVIPLLNRGRHHEASRALLTLVPPITIVTLSGILSDAPVTSVKFGLLSVILVPLLVYGVEEPRKMLAGVVWVALAFAGLDALMPVIPTPAGLSAEAVDSALSTLLSALMSCVMFTLSFIYFQRLNITAEERLEVERAKADRLLLNILPRDIAAVLKESEGTIAEQIDSASILFADIVGFTPLSARISPGEVVNLLNGLFSEFDRMAEELGVEKIKTIGDCYMAAAGVPRPAVDHAQSVIRLALAMQEHIKRTSFDGKPLELRIGIHSGAVTAGVIGRKRFIYDLWGDTVNTASRMESQGRPGVIQITDATHRLIGDAFACASAGVITVKGKGEMHVWHVLGPAPR